MSSKKDRDRGAVTYRRLYGAEPKGKRLSMVPGNYTKDGPGKSGEGGARPGLGGDAAAALHSRLLPRDWELAPSRAAAARAARAA